MAEIRFYHLLHSTAYEAMPRLLQKVSDMGMTGSVLVNSHIIKKMSDALWQGGRSTNFIPNDTGDKDSDTPFVITDKYSVDALRSTVFAVDVLPDEIANNLDLVCYMFNGHDSEVLNNARALWKIVSKNDANTVAYYQQGDKGNWQKKA